MPSTRTVPTLLAGLAGLVHAGVLVAVALRLGYAVGPTAYTPVGALWRYGGLAVLAAVPVWLALRYRLLAPLVALALTTGYVLGMELTPPGPTFADVADLEGLEEPTGIVVVENGLYVVRYMVGAPVWLVGFCLLGAVEHAVRTAIPRAPATGVGWFPVPASRRRSALVASVGGLAHAAATTWFAHRLGVTLSGVAPRQFYLYGATGMWTLAAVPLYLLARRRLVAPALSLAALVLANARAEFAAGVDGPYALYFGAWVLPLGVLLAVAAAECGLRRLYRRRRAT